MTPPAVSVIVPTYERREWVCRAVRSVFAQRYQDWELIVVDDGSTDGTEQALRQFGPRLRYLWQENGGVSAARNAGLRLARGEIVAFLDSDDRWLPDHLETVVAMLARHPEAVLASTCERFDFSGHQDVRRTRVVDALPLQILDNWVGYPSGVATRRTHLLEVGGFDERMEVLEDGELWLRLASRGPFAFLRRRTVAKQHTRGSLSERGRRGGLFLSASEQMTSSGQALLAGLARADAPRLAVRALGRLRYCEALRGLAEGDDEAVRGGLDAACRHLPELSDDPWFVDWRFKMLAGNRVRRLHFYETAARLWPNPRSDTALFLRLRAILLALRLRRLRLALGLLEEFPLGAMGRLLIRSRQLGRRLARRRVQIYLHRGRDRAGLPAP